MTRLWPLLVGFSLWALGFVSLYALQALGCLYGWPSPLHRLSLATVALAILLALALTLLMLSRGELPLTPMVRRVGAMATWGAAAATVLTFFPLAFVTICI